MQRKFTLLAAAGFLLAAALWFWRLCNHASGVSFLPRQAPAEWVVYPKPPVLHLQTVAELPAVFRRSIILSEAPPSATLCVRAGRRCAVSINGQTVALPASEGNWKLPQTIEVGSLLRSGENSISITVWNRLGPPALWLALDGRNLELRSDESWEVAYAGSVWRPAHLAAQPMPAAKGNLSLGGERASSSVAGHWRLLTALSLLATGLVLGGRWWFEGRAKKALPAGWRWTADPAWMLLAGIVVLWVLLFAHNVSLVPRNAGFDTDGHLEYVKYIQTHHALPLADQGWEMHQPPLYYWVSATVLSALGYSADSAGGLVALRLLSFGFGLIQIAFVFGSLRLLFPGQASKQVAGLVLAGFLPMQIYLSHYITNEILAACLMSATLFFILRLLRAERVGPGLWVAVGLCLGLALLTKVTAIVLAPFAVGMLLYCALRGARDSRGQRVLPLLLALSACLAVCGWHYWRVWRHFGHPLFAETRWGFGIGWWQDPGYRTAEYFGRFGRSLVEPLFSGLSSFGDGLYSTLWGDGLCGGEAALTLRPPWNYDLMAAGFVLALAPMTLILVGFAVAAIRLVRRLEPAWLLLLGFASAVLLAIIQLNLTVPGYAEAKSFYGLCAVLPLCALVAAGWEILRRNSRALGTVAGVVLALWAMTSYATYWIRGGTATTQAIIGRGLRNAGDYPAAVAHLKAALEADPLDTGATIYLARTFLMQEHVSEAAELAQRAVKAHPADAQCRLLLAAILEQQGQLAAAVESLRRAVELAPDDPNARPQLANCLAKLGRYAESITACREALRLSPGDSEVHFRLGAALLALADSPDVTPTLCGGEPLSFQIPNASTGDILVAESINHFHFALELTPNMAGALGKLAWVLATHPRVEFRNGKEALALAERACKLTDYKDASLMSTLAASQAEAGDYRVAAETAQKAESLAEAAGLPELRDRARRMRELFRDLRPFREGSSVQKLAQ